MQNMIIKAQEILHTFKSQNWRGSWVDKFGNSAGYNFQ